jgi:hypothetical protein
MEAHFAHNVLAGFRDCVPSEPLTPQVWRPEEIALVYIREATSLQLREVKVVFSIVALVIEGDPPASLLHLQLVSKM